MAVPDGERLFLGDGGLETTMIFREGIELPCFAAFPLLRDPDGREALRRYYGEYIAIARRHGAGFALDTPTWRANADWGAKLGYTAAGLADANREAVELAREILAAEQTPATPIAICGTLGPRGDAYRPAELMSARESERYHADQVGTFAAAAVDMVAAYTLAYSDEAVGIVAAAVAAEVPVSISFTPRARATRSSTGRPASTAATRPSSLPNTRRWRRTCQPPACSAAAAGRTSAMSPASARAGRPEPPLVSAAQRAGRPSAYSMPSCLPEGISTRAAT